MAKIVKTNHWHFQFCHNDFECPVQCLWCHPVADFVRKDQIIFLEVTPEIFSVIILCLLGFPKQIHHKGRCGDGALLAVLDGDQCVFLSVTSDFATEALQLLVDEDRAVVKVHALPL